MKRHDTRWIVAGVAVGVLGLRAAVFVQQADLRQPAGREWTLVGGDWGNTRYSTLDRLTVRNVRDLAGAWVMDFPPGITSRATPVVRNGTMYITAGQQVLALNAATGGRVWAWESARGAPSNRGVWLGDDLVFVPLGNEMVALRQKDGEPVWSYTSDPPQGLTPGTYANGVVVVPVTSGDQFRRWRVVGLDARTGKELWRFNVVPGPGEKGFETWPQNSEVWKYGGGAVWMPPSVDRDLNLVYFGTGNAVPQYAGQVRPGDNLFDVSVVAVDLTTGEYRWHYQLLRHDIWEMDLSTPLVLYDAVVNGQPRKGLAVIRTDGYVFLLDRATGAPIFPVEERRMKQDAFLKTAATQRFPKGADQLGPNCVEKGMVPEGFRRGCYYDLWLPKESNNLAIPLLTTRFAPMAFSPRTKRFYVTACVYPSWANVRFDAKFEDAILFVAPSKIPTSKGYGLLTAFDSGTNRIAWQQRLPYPSCAGSGALATAGDLVFHGHSNGEVQAYDAQSGARVWQFQTGSTRAINVALGPGMGPVVTYETGGEQYLATVMGSALWTFKRGGTLSPRKPGVPAEWVAPFEGPLEATNQIASSMIVRRSIPHLVGAREVPDEYNVAPLRARVRAGTPVTFKNTGTEAHRFVARDGAWQTALIRPGESASVTIARPGEYVYICTEHPWTIGQLVVDESGGVATAQVQRGEAAYRRSCSSCHLDNLSGVEPAPALAGDPFLNKWNGADVHTLFDRIKRSMPADNPASLTDQQYVDITVFLLNANGAAPGAQELPASADVLKGITIRKGR